MSKGAERMELQSFWNFARAHPDHLMVIDPDGSETRASALLASANQLVHGLRARGLEPGDRVAMMLPNRVEVFELFMAVAQAGFRVTPINWHLTAPEIAYILGDSAAKIFVADARFANVAKAAASEARVPQDACFAVGDVEGLCPYAELKAAQPSATPRERSAGGPMTYTSGTTGNPKGVVRPVATADADQVAHQQAMFLCMFGMLPGEEGVHLVVSPTYHTAVLNFASNHLHLGHTLVLMDRWTPEGMLELISRYRVTSSHMVPTQMTRLLKLPEEARRRYDVSSLRHMIHSAAPCPIDVKAQLLSWWGPCIYEYYAASEGGGTLATPEDWQRKPGTVGKPWPISQVRVLDERGKPCPTGEVGTVWMRMGDHTFEYHQHEEKTKQAWNDGFFTVGDMGLLDEDGYLFLRDRKLDMIISGGVNIYPAEIEAVLVMHPQVRDVAVFGVPNDDWGEEVKAVVELCPEAAPEDATRDSIKAFAAERLGRYKLPRSIDFVDALPRDPNGKLYKRKLRDLHWAGRGSAIQ